MVVSVVVIIDNQIHSSITDQTTHDLAGEARLLATEWRAGVDPDALADEAGVATRHRITLIESKGHVVGDSQFDGTAPHGLENHRTPPAGNFARDKGEGTVRRNSPVHGAEQR